MTRCERRSLLEWETRAMSALLGRMTDVRGKSSRGPRKAEAEEKVEPGER
jgi:hypothetical protein